jgi:hypothetical protein
MTNVKKYKSGPGLSGKDLGIAMQLLYKHNMLKGKQKKAAERVMGLTKPKVDSGRPKILGISPVAKHQTVQTVQTVQEVQSSDDSEDDRPSAFNENGTVKLEFLTSKGFQLGPHFIEWPVLETFLILSRLVMACESINLGVEALKVQTAIILGDATKTKEEYMEIFTNLITLSNKYYKESGLKFQTNDVGSLQLNLLYGLLIPDDGGNYPNNLLERPRTIEEIEKIERFYQYKDIIAQVVANLGQYVQKEEDNDDASPFHMLLP